MLNKAYLFILVLLVAAPCYADLPMTINLLNTTKSKLSFNFSLTHSNREKIYDYSGIINAKTISGGNIRRPFSRSSTKGTNAITLNLSAYYKINKGKTNIYSILSANFNHNVALIGTKQSKNFSKEFGDLILGVNHQLSPVLHVFAQSSAFENTTSGFVHGRKRTIGFSAYSVIDPVVLSLQASYNYKASKNIDGKMKDPAGYSLSISPGLAFRINDEITASTSVGYGFKGKQKIGDDVTRVATIKTNLNFGINYTVSKYVTLAFKINSDMSGNDGTNSTFNLSYDFE